MSETPILVIDNGRCTIKGGFAGDDHPTVISPTAVGLTAYGNLSDQETFERFMDASSSGEFKTRYPISNGTITNWEDMETVWRHVIEDQLSVNSEETTILITEPASTPKPVRGKMAEILFESLNFSAVSIATSPILPMYAAGRTTGIVLDIGDGSTQVVHVWGGYPITEAMQRIDFGGHEVTQLLSKELISKQGRFVGNTTPPEVFRLIKEKACHVVPDYEQAKGKLSPSTFTLPNGEKVELGEGVAFQCTEMLFSPGRFEEKGEDNHVGVHQLVYKSITKTNMDVRKDLYSNIVLSGGSTLFPGFVERLENEIKALVPAGVSDKIKIVSHPARKYFTWIGGSVLASLASFPSSMITKECWEDGSGKAALERLNY